MLSNETYRKYPRIINIVFVVTWMCLLINTDSYYFNYLLVGLLCLASLFFNVNNNFSKRNVIITIFFSIIFSGLISLSNYSIYYNCGVFTTLVLLFFLFITGVTTFYILLKSTYSLVDKLYKCLFAVSNNPISTKKVFVLTFLFISITDLLVLFLSQYPGELSTDSINQITQIITGTYSNHHPYWHTMIIKTFYDLGYSLFADINAAVATYSVFQIVVMALIESYANMTLRQIGTNKIVNILFCLFFALVPYNYIYSITVWKDVLFGGALLLFTVCLVRILKNIGNNKINNMLYIVSCFGFGLLRSNGWYAFALSTLLFIPLLLKKYKQIIIIMVMCLGITFVMEHPLLEKFNVSQPDLIESLSIPSQQIARAIIDNNDLSMDELDLLNKVIDVDKIEESYKSYISNPIKDLVRERNNQSYLRDNIMEFLYLYINLGLRNPFSYIFAFVDETKGYYNSGYDFWICSTGVAENSFGIQRIEKVSALTNLINIHNDCHSRLPFLNPIVSVGVHVWLVMICLYIGIMNKNKYVCIICIPLLAIVLSLLIATPVFCEFRYAYAIFTCAYFVLLTTIKYSGEKDYE